MLQSGFGPVKRRDVEKVSVLTKWRQSSDPAKDSSSGSEKSSYVLRKVYHLTTMSIGPVFIGLVRLL